MSSSRRAFRSRASSRPRALRTFRSSRVTGGGLSGAQTALLVEITAASLFVGVGGSLSADHKSVVAGTVGISASGVSLRFASVKDGLDTFTDLELSVASASLVGIPGIVLFVSDLKLVQSTSTSVASLDFSALGSELRGAADCDAHDLLWMSPSRRASRSPASFGGRLGPCLQAERYGWRSLRRADGAAGGDHRRLALRRRRRFASRPITSRSSQAPSVFRPRVYRSALPR